jgi:predicted lipoprotein with Yx(FWY)xxD motif
MLFTGLARATPRVSTLALVKTTTSRMLVTAKGMTLYQLTLDKKNHSTCTGQCVKFWPPLVLPSGTRAPSAVPGIHGTFGVASLVSGGKQLTLNGAPLYTFIKDKKLGDINGEGVLGTWWIVIPPSAPSHGSGTAASALVKTAPLLVLTNSKSMTLYLFTADKKNQSACTGPCSKFWPPLLLPSGTPAPSAVRGIHGTFGVAKLANGGKQLTLNGSPLYTFAGDKKAGDINGEGIIGKWWIAVAPPAPSAAHTAATSTLTPTSTSALPSSTPVPPTTTPPATPTVPAPTVAVPTGTAVPAPPTSTPPPVPTSTPVPPTPMPTMPPPPPTPTYSYGH